MKNASNTSVLIIYTGGTIGMIENPQTGALENFGLERFRQMVPELHSLGYNIEIIAFNPPIDSSNMSPREWVELARLICHYYHRFDGFVILHGTDTMAYTASAMSFMLENLNKPVIFTGSQLPIGQLRTDGKENLLTSVEIAATKNEDGSATVPEVCIYFDSQLMRGNRTTKINSEGFNAFRSFNFPPLAIAGINIKYDRHLILKRDPKAILKPHFRFDDHVMTLTIFPGIRREYVEIFLKLNDLKCLMIKTFGSGNAPQNSWLGDILKQLNDRGVVIVNNTQCSKGAVEMSRYGTGLQLLQAGVINGHDATPEATITKMMMLLGMGYSKEKIEELMNTDICGEINI